MSTREGRPAMGGLRDPRATDRFQSIGQRPAAERPETIEQARRWDVQKSRALAHGLCDRCAAQYAWGSQIGFTHSRPPCSSCALIVDAAIGEVRTNGWRNMRLRDVGTDDTRKGRRAHRSRTVTPEKYVHGYGRAVAAGRRGPATRRRIAPGVTTRSSTLARSPGTGSAGAATTRRAGAW